MFDVMKCFLAAFSWPLVEKCASENISADSRTFIGLVDIQLISCIWEKKVLMF